MKHVISTTTAPGAVGPYSQAIEANGFVFVSGQLPLDPATGAFVPGGTSEQAEQSIKNLLAVLEAAGCKAEDVVKTTVFMIDIGDFGVVNEVYGKYFSGECPARCAMQAAALPKGALVEIEAIAEKQCVSPFLFAHGRGIILKLPYDILLSGRKWNERRNAYHRLSLPRVPQARHPAEKRVCPERLGCGREL